MIRSSDDLTAYLHTHIPLSAAMEVSATQANADAVVLSAPLAPNLNHRSSVFGGSLTTLAILSAWSWLRVHFEGTHPLPTLVIQSEQMEFLAPAVGSFAARCAAPDERSLRRFRQMHQRYGRGRIVLESTVSCEGQAVARFSGEFVAVFANPVHNATTSPVS